MDITLAIAGQEVRFPFGDLDRVLADLKQATAEVEDFVTRDALGNGKAKPLALRSRQICGVCGRECASPAGLAAHIRAAHTPKPIRKAKKSRARKPRKA